MKVEAVGLLPESCSLLISQLGMIRDGCSNLFAGTSKHLVISDNFTSPSARKMIFDCGNHHRHLNSFGIVYPALFLYPMRRLVPYWALY